MKGTNRERRVSWTRKKRRRRTAKRATLRSTSKAINPAAPRRMVHLHNSKSCPRHRPHRNRRTRAQDTRTKSHLPRLTHIHSIHTRATGPRSTSARSLFTFNRLRVVFPCFSCRVAFEGLEGSLVDIELISS